MRNWRLTQLTEDKLRTYPGHGWWVDRRLVDYLDEAAAASPDKPAIVDRAGPMTYAELRAAADNVAAGLAALGVEPGDVVACQLPNWREVLVLACACGRMGAVYNGIAPIFRERDMAAMVRIGQPKVLVVPDTFRGFSHAAMART
ncbi:MAG: AMP-binding protein, partial [Streptosporangiaceae bacterium]